MPASHDWVCGAQAVATLADTEESEGSGEKVPAAHSLQLRSEVVVPCADRKVPPGHCGDCSWGHAAETPVAKVESVLLDENVPGGQARQTRSIVGVDAFA